MVRKSLVVAMSLFGLAGVAGAAPIPKPGAEAPATPEQRKAAQQRLKEIGLGLHNYESAYQVFPDDLYDPKTKKPLLSWRVMVLPYMEEEELFKQFKLDEPWDSDHNKKLIPKIPKVYAPIRVKDAEAGSTFIRSFSGADASFGRGLKNPIRIAGITDGTSNTIAVVEAGEGVIWTKPGTDLPFDSAKPLPKLGREIDGAFHVLMWDGSVMAVKREFDEATFKNAVTPNGGEPIVVDVLKAKE